MAALTQEDKVDNLERLLRQKLESVRGVPSVLPEPVAPAAHAPRLLTSPTVATRLHAKRAG